MSNDGDFLERLLMPQGKEELDAVFDHGRKLIDRIVEMLAPLDSDSVLLECMRAVRNTRDLDYVHFFFFACIPTVADVTAQIKAKCSSAARWERFLNELIYCRSTLLDGLTADRSACKTNLDAHFKNIRHFVAYMREFYMMRSESLKRRYFDPTVPVAFWNDTDKIAASTDFAKEGGTTFFYIIGTLVFFDFCIVYCGDPKERFEDKKTGLTYTFQDMPEDPERKSQPMPYQAIFPRPFSQMQNHRARRRPILTLQATSEPPPAGATVLTVVVSPVVQ